MSAASRVTAYGRCQVAIRRAARNQDDRGTPLCV